VSGSLALLLWDVLLLGLSALCALSANALGWEALQHLPIANLLRERSQVSLFCELLVSGALAICLPAAGLLQTVFATVPKVSCPRTCILLC
jgi:hypothetical protein